MVLCCVTAAVVLVFMGYFALWSAAQANTPAGISAFGKVMAIILFVMAGLVLVSGIACRHGFCGGRMMGKMGCGAPAMMNGMQGMPGCGMGHMPGMMAAGKDNEKPGMPAEENTKPKVK